MDNKYVQRKEKKMTLEKTKMGVWGWWWRGAILNFIIGIALGILGVLASISSLFTGGSISIGVIIFIIIAPFIVTWIVRWIY